MYKIYDQNFQLDHPHECWDQEADAFYQHGSYNQRPGKCEMIRCYADSTMESVGCHTKTLQAGCTASSTDFKKSYPDCCPRITCAPPPQLSDRNDHHYTNHHNHFYNNNHNFNPSNGNQKAGKQTQNTNSAQSRPNTNLTQTLQSSGTVGVKG